MRDELLARRGSRSGKHRENTARHFSIIETEMKDSRLDMKDRTSCIECDLCKF